MVDLNENSDTQTGFGDPIQVDVDEVVQEGHEPQEKKRQSSHRSQRHRGKAKREHRQRSFLFWLSEFRFELLALILFGLGVFLLLAPFKISTWLMGHVTEVLVYTRDVFAWLVGMILAIDKSDIGGVVLLVTAAGLIGFDIRTRVLRRHERIEAEPLCAKCGRQMRRARTSRFYQGLGTVFRVRIKRFCCSKCSHRISVWRPPHESDW